jgi:hypothetical protein
MTYLHPLLENLRKEIPYQWRVQSRNKDKTKAICSAYIDARDVMNTLDKYCEHGWQTDVKELAGFIFYGIGVEVPELTSEGKISGFSTTLWRWDTGARIEDNEKDNMYEQAGKSAASDALKRAAVQWGVGRFLYDLPTVTLPCDQYGNVVDERGNRVWDLTKHINDKNKGKTGSISVAPKSSAISVSNTETKPAEPKPAEAKPVTKTAPKPEVQSTEVTNEIDEKPVLTPEKLDAMLNFIKEGKIDQVVQAMDKYKMNLAQKTTLNALIKQAKK